MIVNCYKFERNDEDPDLYRFRYYQAKTVSQHTLPKLWKPWSKWISLQELSSEIHTKKQGGYTFKLNDLKKMPPGTTKTMTFKKEQLESQLKKNNGPEDIGKIRKTRRLAGTYQLSVRANSVLDLDWQQVPINADDILGNFMVMYERVPKDLFFYKLDQLAPHLDLTQEEKTKFSTSKQSGDIAALIECLRVGIQLLINDRKSKGESLLQKDTPIKTDNNEDIVKIKSKDHIYTVSLKNRSCDCKDFKIVGYFGFLCKHLYAAHLRWKLDHQNDYN